MNRGEDNLITAIDMAFIDWSLRQFPHGDSKEQDVTACQQLGCILLSAAPSLMASVASREVALQTAQWASTIFVHYPNATLTEELFHCAELASELALDELCISLVWATIRCGGVTEKVCDLVFNAEPSMNSDVNKLALLHIVLIGELEVPESLRRQVALRVDGGEVRFHSKAKGKQARTLSKRALS